MRHRRTTSAPARLESPPSPARTSANWRAQAPPTPPPSPSSTLPEGASTPALAPGQIWWLPSAHDCLPLATTPTTTITPPVRPAPQGAHNHRVVVLALSDNTATLATLTTNNATPVTAARPDAAAFLAVDDLPAEPCPHPDPDQPRPCAAACYVRLTATFQARADCLVRSYRAVRCFHERSLRVILERAGMALPARREEVAADLLARAAKTRGEGGRRGGGGGIRQPRAAGVPGGIWARAERKSPATRTCEDGLEP